MSFDAINWATKQRVGNATAKHALLWLAFHANGRSGECFPSVELLMEEMEVGSKNTVKAALKTLIDAGLISSKREMKGNRVSRTFYCLNVDGSISDPSNIDGSIIDRSNIDADGSITDPYGSNSDRLMGQPLTPNKEGNKEENKERNREVSMRTSGNSSAIAAVASAQAQTPYPEDFDQSLFDEAQREAQLAGSKPNTVKAEAPKRRTATPRKKPATRCPFDAEALIPDDYRQIAEKAGIGDPQQVFSAFVNHAIAHDRSLVVWPAGFRTWCSNELRYHPNQTPKPKPLHQRTAADYDW
nr:MAG TPA: helix-turn-helix domain protein [Caudoviricetes sp.]